jgi:E3 ubiquitin-protein transferase RMND5
MDALQQDIAALNKAARLSTAAGNVDRIIELLVEAREQIAQSKFGHMIPDAPIPSRRTDSRTDADTHTANATMMKLQKPIKEGFETINDNLKEVSKGQRNLGKALDKVLLFRPATKREMMLTSEKSFPLQQLPSDQDTMAKYPSLINRAIAMHLLREGQFDVASTFIGEAQDSPPAQLPVQNHPRASHIPSDDLDATMEDDDDEEKDSSGADSTGDQQDLSSLQSQELQSKFSEMYQILQDLKARKLTKAIEWARANSKELESRGSNLEFELSKLQYVWLFKGHLVNGLPDDEYNGTAGALAYARRNFKRFQGRHLREIQQLISAMSYAPNLGESPYKAIFHTESAFGDVSTSFTREFCSLLGLSAESPLYIAATAGALALPKLIKYNQHALAKGTEWTTSSELAFETPLPERMVYHSIFVCPVSKEQTTDANPPMIIPCGHVLARETLQKLCKGQRFKCPYCPSEGQFKDARQIIL